MPSSKWAFQHTGPTVHVRGCWSPGENTGPSPSCGSGTLRMELGSSGGRLSLHLAPGVHRGCCWGRGTGHCLASPSRGHLRDWLSSLRARHWPARGPGRSGLGSPVRERCGGALRGALPPLPGLIPAGDSAVTGRSGRRFLGDGIGFEGSDLGSDVAQKANRQADRAGGSLCPLRSEAGDGCHVDGAFARETGSTFTRARAPHGQPGSAALAKAMPLLPSTAHLGATQGTHPMPNPKAKGTSVPCPCPRFLGAGGPGGGSRPWLEVGVSRERGRLPKRVRGRPAGCGPAGGSGAGRTHSRSPRAAPRHRS